MLNVEWGWVIWGISIVLIACTIGWAVYLHNTNQTLESYALRYRILLMEHSVSNSSFAQLDSILETHRSDEAQIKQLKERVINHGLAFKRQAELRLQHNVSARKKPPSLISFKNKKMSPNSIL